MIIFQIHVKHIAIGKTKSYPPVSSDTDTPRASAITCERVKPKAGQIHIVQTFGLIKNQ